MGDLAIARLVAAIVVDGPEQRQKGRRRGLDQRRDEDVVGAEADTAAAQGRARFLVERPHVLGDLATLDQAVILVEPVGEALGDALQTFGCLQIEQRLEDRGDLVGDGTLDPRRDLVARHAGQLLVGEQHRLRLQRIVTGRQHRHRRTEPADKPVRAQRDVAIG